MRERGGEPVATDEPTVIAKALLDAIVVENNQGDARLANSASTDESDRSEVFCQTDDFLVQFATAKVGSRWWRWRFPGRTRCERKTPVPLLSRGS